MTTERAYFGYEHRLEETCLALVKAETEIERLRSDNERLKEWCRKLIEGGTFPGEADSLRNDLTRAQADRMIANKLNAELVAALEFVCFDHCFKLLGSVTHDRISAALAKVREGK